MFASKASIFQRVASIFVSKASLFDSEYLENIA